MAHFEAIDEDYGDVGGGGGGGGDDDDDDDDDDDYDYDDDDDDDDDDADADDDDDGRGGGDDEDGLATLTFRLQLARAMRSGSSSSRSKSVRAGVGRQRRLDPQCNSARHSSTRHDTFELSAARHSTTQHSTARGTVHHDRYLEHCNFPSPKFGVLETFPCFTFLHPFPGSWVDHVVKKHWFLKVFMLKSLQTQCVW